MTNNKKLLAWVDEWAQICQPDKIHWCDGSEEENQRLLDGMGASGAAVKLNEEKQLAVIHSRVTLRMWPALKTAPTFVPAQKKMPGIPTTGWTRKR
jgi:phosphoenolpyruvate carboxykinase (GTP)